MPPARGDPARAAEQQPVPRHPRGQRHGQGDRRPHREGDRIQPGQPADGPRAPGDRVRVRSSTLRLPPDGGHPDPGHRHLRDQRRDGASRPRLVPVLPGAGRRPDAAAPAGHRQRQSGARGPADGGAEGDRQAPCVDRGLRQHGCPVLGQDGHADRGRRPRSLGRRFRGESQREGATLCLPECPIRVGVRQSDRRGDPRRSAVRPDRLSEARRSALRLPPQAAQHPRRGGRPVPPRDQGGGRQRAGCVFARGDGRGNDGGARGGEGRDRPPLRGAGHRGIPHARRGLPRPRPRHVPHQGARDRHDLRGIPRAPRPAQGSHRGDGPGTGRARRHPEDHHGR